MEMTNNPDSEKKAGFGLSGSIPEWVTHLLTGLGTMGAQYMLFVKPIQEKAEQQAEQIRKMQKRIDKLEALLHNEKRVIPQPDREAETEYRQEGEQRQKSRKKQYNTEEDQELFPVRYRRHASKTNNPFSTYKP